MKKSDLVNKKCFACQPGSKGLTEAEITLLAPELPEWQREGGYISRNFKFNNYYETMAFVNSVAWLAHREDHHPDLEVGYNKCKVRYNTHEVKGLSENDFICAAKVDALFE